MQPTLRQVPPKRAALVDASGLQAKLAQPDCGIVAAGSAAKDNCIELVGHAWGLSFKGRKLLMASGVPLQFAPTIFV